MAENTVSQVLAEYIHNVKAQDIPQEVRALAKLRILDALGCAVAGRELPHSKIALKVAKKSVGNSTVIGFGAGVTLLDAVFANGVLIHSIVQDDILSGLVHPGSTVIPAVLGVGEDKGASGEDVLTATVVGYELIGRIMRGVGQFAIPTFRPSPILTTFGAVAAAGKLMKLTEGQLANAIGYAASHTPGTPNQAWWSGTMEGMFEAGVSARTGLLSALFAEAGATASPQILEGKDGFFRCWGGGIGKKEKALEDLGKDFVVSRTRIKAFPVCGANQRPTETAIPLAQYKLKARDIKRIIERVGIGGTKYAGLDFSGPFKTQFQAIMSMQFCVAAAVLGRPVTSASFFAQRYDDPEVGELAEKVELIEEEGRSYPSIEIHTVDGKTYTTEEGKQDKSRYRPTKENMIQKFRFLCTGFSCEKRIDEIIELVLDIDNLDAIQKLTQRLRE